MICDQTMSQWLSIVATPCRVSKDVPHRALSGTFYPPLCTHPRGLKVADLVRNTVALRSPTHLRHKQRWTQQFLEADGFPQESSALDPSFTSSVRVVCKLLENQDLIRLSSFL